MKDSTMTIRIASDFSRFPAGRYTTDGPYSGQGFLENNLIPALQKGAKVKIDLD